LIRRGGVPAALSILAAVLGLVHLGTRSVWLDEAVTVNIARLEPAPFLRALAADAGNMSAYYAVMRAWVHLGEQEWVVRLPSVAFFSAAVAALWLLADRLFGRAVATTAALLLAVSPSGVRYAQEARGYALELLLVVASWWALVHAVRRRSAWAWAGYVAVSALAVYTHFFGALVVAAQAVAVWVSSASRSRRAPLVAMSAVAMSAVPLAILVRRQGTAQVQWIPPLDGRQLAEAVSLLTGAGTEYGWARLALAVVVSAAVALGVARAWTGMRQGPPGTSSVCYAVALAWLVVPTVSALLVSVARPMLVPRYLLVVLPAAVLLAAVGLQAALRPARAPSYWARWLSSPCTASGRGTARTSVSTRSYGRRRRTSCPVTGRGTASSSCRSRTGSPSSTTGDGPGGLRMLRCRSRHRTGGVRGSGSTRPSSWIWPSARSPATGGCGW